MAGERLTSLRTCVHRILHVSFRQILPIAALKKLTIRVSMLSLFRLVLGKIMLENPCTNPMNASSE